MPLAVLTATLSNSTWQTVRWREGTRGIIGFGISLTRKADEGRATDTRPATGGQRGSCARCCGPHRGDRAGG